MKIVLLSSFRLCFFSLHIFHKSCFYFFVEKKYELNYRQQKSYKLSKLTKTITNQREQEFFNCDFKLVINLMQLSR